MEAKDPKALLNNTGSNCTSSFTVKAVSWLSVALLAVSPCVGLPCIPAVLLGILWLVEIVRHRRRFELLPTIILANIAWWAITFSIYPQTVTWHFLHWQLRAVL